MKGKWLVEVGICYDYKWMCIYKEDFIMKKMYLFDYNWQNVSGLIGLIYFFIL